MSCNYCAQVEEVGHGPAHENHCRDCHRSWRGGSELHCASCHRQFGGEVAFSAHQKDGICRDPATLLTKPKDGSKPQPRFRPVQRKDGYVWVKADRAGNAYRPGTDGTPDPAGPPVEKSSRVACRAGSERSTVRVA